MKVLTHIADVVDGKTTIGRPRSSEWPKVRKEHLKLFPTCAVCGGAENLQIHHIIPYHIDNTKELDKSNLITLCESKGSNHHILFGHLGNFKSFNPDVEKDAAVWNAKIKNRKY